MYLPTQRDLKERRKSLELTQSELADRAGVSQPLIARIEGDDVDPRLSTLRRIVEALNEAEGGVVRAADLMNEGVVDVRPDESVHATKELMDERGYSQVPVILEGVAEGIISNNDIVDADGEYDSVGDLPVAEVMSESVRTVEPETPIEQVDNLLEHNRVVLVKTGGEVVGIITEADVAAEVS